MNMRLLSKISLAALVLGLVAVGYGRADDPKEKPEAKDAKAEEKPQPTAAKPRPKYPPYSELLADAQTKIGRASCRVRV